ncbi:TldD/PmbA family protein [Qipengyuania aurantiaca]|uniref:TldD/PmbA family protein n=1 Tax=Qipengyuania aurantiaca TaxID=2867233 RepID=A0ABX8ZNQ7_9SPHN|nr:TldD/PmbA family protein [Qipengyuania aurantiaca]QZD90625.1 TldD/PmbA family protein [Qipengyuania aurantiaca]
MIDTDTALLRCQDLVALAQRMGADAADAVARANASESVSMRLGALEEVERSESEEIGLRVFVGKRSASIHTSDFAPEGLKALAERAVQMARHAPEDRHAGLAPAETQLSGDLPDLELADTHRSDPEALREAALAVEEAARSVAGVTNSNGGSASASRSVAALATSTGFARGYAGSGFSLSASVIAGEGGAMQTDHASRSARFLADLVSPEEVGREAGQRAVARLNPVSMPSRKLPIVFEPRIAGGLVGHLLGAMSAPAIARKASFLLDREEEPLFDSAVRILEEPLRKRGMRSRPFDGEGVACCPRALVEGGKLTGWLTNVSSADQLGLSLTGHASRGSGGSPGVSASNVHMEKGTVSPQELMADIEDGLYVTSLFGQGVNGVTGDYSRGATGFRIRKGEITEPVAEITIAGNLLEMFRALTPADDLEMIRSINVPTLRIDGMTVAGE